MLVVCSPGIRLVHFLCTNLGSMGHLFFCNGRSTSFFIPFAIFVSNNKTSKGLLITGWFSSKGTSDYQARVLPKLLDLTSNMVSGTVRWTSNHVIWCFAWDLIGSQDSLKWRIYLPSYIKNFHHIFFRRRKYCRIWIFICALLSAASTLVLLMWVMPSWITALWTKNVCQHMITTQKEKNQTERTPYIFLCRSPRNRSLSLLDVIWFPYVWYWNRKSKPNNLYVYLW